MDGCDAMRCGHDDTLRCRRSLLGPEVTAREVNGRHAVHLCGHQTEAREPRQQRVRSCEFEAAH